MGQYQSKSIKSTIIIGYILLFLIGAVSITFLYREIHNAKKPNDEFVLKNQQLLDLSAALAKLYSAETANNNSHYSTTPENYQQYVTLIDSAIYKMSNIKKNDNSEHDIKLDSITTLLNQKKSSFNKILELNQRFISESSSLSIQNKIQRVRDSLRKSIKRQVGPKSEIVRDVEDYLSIIFTQRQIDSLSGQSVNEKELLLQYDNVLTSLIIKEERIRKELREKEKALQIENQILTNKIQILIHSLEKQIREDSYLAFNTSQRELEQTTKILLWVGIIGVFLVILFGYIILGDLNKQQEYRKLLEKLNSDNAALLKSKSMLLATVTHDLQTPLGSISGFSDLLSNTPLTTKQTNYLSNIKNSSNYIMNLVNDLTDFSKLENNRIKIHEKSFNPKEMIESLYYTLKPIAREKEIELFYIVDQSADISIISDPQRVKQILMNLLTNAIKFTPQGSVTMFCNVIDNQVVFKVSDTGIGISKKHQERIFDAFTQATDDIDEKFGGTGLGLTISKSFTELLGGKIWLESIIDQGTTFTFSIPLVKDDAKKVVQTPEEIDLEFLKNKRIIIVDDDRIQLSLMEAMFSKFQMKITLLNDATKVIPLLDKNSYDLLISDIQMPKKSGFELIRKIRNHANPTVNSILAVALSGKRDLSLEQYIEKGFNYYLSKPLKLSEAIVALANLLDHQNYIPEQNETPEVTKTEKLYDLQTIIQYLPEDNATLKNIISVYIKSSEQSIEELIENQTNPDRLSQIAHRMLPMVKQLEIATLITPLSNLEDKLVLDEDLKPTIEQIERDLRHVLKALQNDILA